MHLRCTRPFCCNCCTGCMLSIMRVGFIISLIVSVLGPGQHAHARSFVISCITLMSMIFTRNLRRGPLALSTTQLGHPDDESVSSHHFTLALNTWDGQFKPHYLYLLSQTHCPHVMSRGMYRLRISMTKDFQFVASWLIPFCGR